MKKIEMETWKRLELYNFFTGMSQPFYSVTFTVDVTNLYRFTKENQLSFYYAMVYFCTKAVNKVENLLYTIRGGEIYLLDKRRPSFTELKKGEDQFQIVTMDCGDDATAFCRMAKEKSAAQTAFVEAAEETDDLIYFSCLPWVELTAFTNERDFDADDNVPRITWGKYTEDNGRKKLNLAMELNHRFADGVHIGRFYEELKGMLEKL